MMCWPEDTDVVVVFLATVGQMHSGFLSSPINLFFRNVWMPTVIRYLGR